MRLIVGLLSLAALGSCSRPGPEPSTLILWAWERPEDLRFAKGRAEVAVQTGFVEITGERLFARGRRHPLFVDAAPTTAVVHVQIASGRKLAWTPRLRRQTSATIVHYATRIPVERVQIDFEVRASERQALLDVLRDVRSGLPRRTRLSMTALASWCDTETWLDQAPVDEIVPMVFRMQRGDGSIRTRLAEGRDFRHPRCRTALGIATDTPIDRAPPGRRVYVFHPRSWSKTAFDTVRDEVQRWR
jgi:hypothetical protein